MARIKPFKGIRYNPERIDALANVVTATRLENAGATLPALPPVDQCGLPMEMVYARFAVRR